MRIGLVPMAAKPYHAGHDRLVRIAASENDEVHLFISTSDRKRPGELPILGSTMHQIWRDFIEPTLPPNVLIYYGGVPVTKVYEEIQNAETSGSDNEYSIYSDEEDILKFSDEKLARFAPVLFSNNQISKRGISRTETVPISGTEMRSFLKTGDKKKFISLLPQQIRSSGNVIYDMLRRNVVEEVTLREYIRNIVNKKV